MKFEKVSYEQFAKDYTKIFYENSQMPIDLESYLKQIYENIKIPTRGTKGSAAYDLSTPISFKLEPGEVILIPSGIRAIIDEDKVFMIYSRSSTGMRGLYITNSVGIIDSDYSSASNEGHIMFGVGNRSDAPIRFSEGDRILQGIITKYFTVDDDNTNEVRTGGIGSTNK